MSVGRGHQKHDWQLRPTTKQSLNLVAPEGAFPRLGKTPGRIRVPPIPGALGARIPDHIYAVDDFHTCQLPDHAQKEKPERPDTQPLTTFPILTDADHPSLRKASRLRRFRMSAKVVHHHLIAHLPGNLNESHHQDTAFSILPLGTPSSRVRQAAGQRLADLHRPDRRCRGICGLQKLRRCHPQPLAQTSGQNAQLNFRRRKRGALYDRKYCTI